MSVADDALGLAAGNTTTINGLPRPSRYYTGGFALIMTQQRIGTYDLRDVSGSFNDAISNLFVSEASAYANPGYYTFPGGDYRQALPIPTFNMDLLDNSYVLSFRVNMAVPTAQIDLLGNAGSAGGSPGIRVLVTTSGLLLVAINIGGVSSSATLSSIAVADGTPHDVVIATDHRSGDVYIAIDGQPLPANLALFSPMSGSGVPTQLFAVGGNRRTTTGTVFPAAKLGAVQMLVFPDGLPINLPQIAARIAASPHQLLTDGEVAAPASRRAFLAVVGQSNEGGRGSIPEQTRSFGPALFDPVAPKGQNKGSMYPRIAELAARRGRWLQVANTAVGSTSIIHSWTGVLRAWISGMKVLLGTYALSGGNVYRASFVPTPNMSSTSQPTGTSATQTGADGITWTYKGAARAQDVDGYIYPHTDTYFDPNGYFAAVGSALTNARGYSAKYVYISIGQGDSGIGTTKSEFASGLTVAANYALSLGAKAIIGFTCYNASAGADDGWQTSIPAATVNTDPSTDTAPGVGGWWQALQNFAGNASVIRGPNLRYELGQLPSDSSFGVEKAFFPALMSADGDIHMNTPAMRLAATRLDTAVVNAGDW